jgi:MipA family protein
MQVKHCWGTRVTQSRMATRFLIIVAGLCWSWSSVAAIAADLTGNYQSISATVSETTSSSGFHGMIGAGLFNGESILVDSQRRTALRPLLFLRYEDWAYLSLRGGGVWLLQSPDRSLRLGLGVSVHSGYNPYHEADLAGMDGRRSSLDAGVNASWRTSLVDVGLSYAHDVGDASNGDTASFRVSHGFQINPRLRLTPNIVARWESLKVVDYYYGVRPDEVLPDRPAYQGRETTNLVTGLSADYRLTQSWSLLGDVRTTHFGSGITDSPIVERKESTWGFVGAGWHF